MKYFMFLILIVFTSCNKTKKEDLELEIVTREINSLNVKTDNYYNSIVNPINLKKSKSIIVYKLINKSNKAYYFNIDSYNENLEENAIKTDRVYVSIIDEQDRKVTVHNSSPSGRICVINNIKKMEFLDYKNQSFNNYKNFIIHPNETLYFEWFIILPYGNLIEDKNYQVELDTQKKYFAELLMYSDGLNYKKQVSRTDLKTIQENGYEVYNGVIKSKNKVPIVFNKP